MTLEEKQFATPLGISTLPDMEFDEILDYNPKKGWSSTKNFIYYSSWANGEKALTTSGEVGVYQKRSGGKILQHIFTKEQWDKDKAWEYLEGLAEKAIKLLSLKLRFEDMEPVKLAELDDDDLSEDHDRLHRYYAEWLVGEHREEGDWSYGDLLQKHAFVVDELKKRGKKCEYDDELAKPVRKGLVETIKEATESFVWDDGNGPIRVIIKGGPGSGHHGHAGRPGQVGGSAAGGGYGGMLRGMDGWDGLSDEKKKEWAAAASGIPNAHIEKLTEARIHDAYIDELYPDKIVAGVYLNRRITLHSERATGITVTHEVGHHVLSEQRRTISYQISGDLRKAKETWFSKGGTRQVRATGLRKNSIADREEFFADSYSIWAGAKQGNKASRNFQVHYRGLFPDATKALDDLFE